MAAISIEKLESLLPTLTMNNYCEWSRRATLSLKVIGAEQYLMKQTVADPDDDKDQRILAIFLLKTDSAVFPLVQSCTSIKSFFETLEARFNRQGIGEIHSCCSAPIHYQARQPAY
jgi:hypothetical protein